MNNTKLSLLKRGTMKRPIFWDASTTPGSVLHLPMNQIKDYTATSTWLTENVGEEFEAWGWRLIDGYLEIKFASNKERYKDLFLLVWSC